MPGYDPQVRLWHLGLIVSALVGCFDPKPESVLTWRSARDWHCDESQVQVGRLGHDLYEATGCGRTQVFDCSGGDDCVPVAPHSR